MAINIATVAGKKMHVRLANPFQNRLLISDMQLSIYILANEPSSAVGRKQSLYLNPQPTHAIAVFDCDPPCIDIDNDVPALAGDRRRRVRRQSPATGCALKPDRSVPRIPNRVFQAEILFHGSPDPLANH